jgi:Kdo2-lipid IVA lauroyltransferase/acyltransferase
MAPALNYRSFLDYLVYVLVLLLEQVLVRLPEHAANAFGRFVGRLLFTLLRDRREAAVENLTIAFGGERSRQWILYTARKSFEHLGLLAVEFFRIRHWTHEQMAERILIDGALPQSLLMMPGNHGIVLLNSHFGCFEVSAATVKFLGIKLNLLATGLKNPFLTRYLFTRGGEKSGVTVFPHRGTVKRLIQLLREGEMVALLGDQRGDAERGIFVDYFGSPAPANEVFAHIAIDGKAHILPLCTYRRDDGRYQSIFGEEITIELTGDPHEDLVAASQQFHDQFEKWIRLNPEQGYWVQRKWRRKPSKRRSRRADH